ncbi:dTDP-4-dehydrorhamnose 3,5-epimerase [Pseudodesulfovibrio sp. F-1]|uniref:dTDP-4-dehydrorhamnose 3,5-epimerase n=1 Tax=Pseudodesulfovibrio alkaliphilus TaxID=2661613 RepID=A0A7K1KPT1_9BACT|nr:dTDP-4-dehydrorhamnose 3,5-epimerase [Pseudodesulfovibrio alkaliphilus]MUM78099.1 dTDP-4-dehydrorhamnose 3,5-epimerase [Pseudodesulfovibrio alkaliphilus]
MKRISTEIEGLYVLESEPVSDHRGRFARLFCARELAEIGLEKPIAQINLSLTRAKGAIRGMHFQNPPHAELKIIRCIRGACFDVAVDLRPHSPSYLKWHAEILTPDNFRAMYIPEGFAHGFQALEPDTELLYCHTEYYVPESEDGVRFDDPAIAIVWPLPVTDMSTRDMQFKNISDACKRTNNAPD